MGPVVNGRFLARQVTGVERYGREVLRALGDRLRVARPEKPTQGWQGHAWEQFVLPGRVRTGEVLWSPANSGPLWVGNQVLTLHDLSALEHPEWYSPGFARWYRLFLPLLARRVRRIVVPSESVRAKTLRRFGLGEERVVCIPEGVDGDRFHPSRRSKEQAGGRPYEDHIGHPYILFVGSLEGRKNLSGLLQAWAMMRCRHPEHVLVVAGGRGEVFRDPALAEKAERVQFRGRVEEAELPGLYAGAELFILPSLDEGFGLTALEAMACGTAVAAARAGSLPEVCGEAGRYFDPRDPGEMARVMEECLDNPELREGLRQKGLERAGQFSWGSSAEKTWQVLQECA